MTERTIAPRVLVRITDATTLDETYQFRCETSGCEQRGVFSFLSLAAREAEHHAVRTGHAVVVEAL